MNLVQCPKFRHKPTVGSSILIRTQIQLSFYSDRLTVVTYELTIFSNEWKRKNFAIKLVVKVELRVRPIDESKVLFYYFFKTRKYSQFVSWIQHCQPNSNTINNAVSSLFIRIQLSTTEVDTDIQLWIQ